MTVDNLQEAIDAYLDGDLDDTQWDAIGEQFGVSQRDQALAQTTAMRATVANLSRPVLPDAVSQRIAEAISTSASVGATSITDDPPQAISPETPPASPGISRFWVAATGLLAACMVVMVTLQIITMNDPGHAQDNYAIERGGQDAADNPQQANTLGEVEDDHTRGRQPSSSGPTSIPHDADAGRVEMAAVADELAMDDAPIEA